MIVNQPYLGGFAGFSGEWEDWCDRNYFTPENNEKCKNCNRINLPLLGPRCTFPDPKTIAGRLARGLPQQTDLERLGPPTQPDTSAPPSSGGIVPTPVEDQLVAGIPNTVLLGGAALLGGGLIYALAKKGKR